jgi:hypothetical protein
MFGIWLSRIEKKLKTMNHVGGSVLLLPYRFIGLTRRGSATRHVMIGGKKYL